jgi:hypothetical protein
MKADDGMCIMALPHTVSTGPIVRACSLLTLAIQDKSESRNLSSEKSPCFQNSRWSRVPPDHDPPSRLSLGQESRRHCRRSAVPSRRKHKTCVKMPQKDMHAERRTQRRNTPEKIQDCGSYLLIPCQRALTCRCCLTQKSASAAVRRTCLRLKNMHCMRVLRLSLVLTVQPGQTQCFRGFYFQQHGKAKHNVSY